MSDALAVRVESCRFWRWLPGMLAFGELELPGWMEGRFRIDAVDDGKCVAKDGRKGEPLTLHKRTLRKCGWSHVKRAVPDLTDPATVGCIWVLVFAARDAMGRDGYNIRRDNDPTCCNPDAGCVVAFGDGDDCHDVSTAVTEGERAAEALLWLAMQETSGE